MSRDLSTVSRSRWVGRPVVAGFLAGLVCGFLVLGLGGRLAMSVIAFSLRGRMQWDLVGTLQVVMLGAALGAPAGLAYSALETRLPGGWLMKGGLFGIGCCAALTAVYFLRPAGPVELQTAPVLGSVLFGALVIAFGLVLAVTVQWCRRLLNPAHPAITVTVAVATVGCLVLSLYALISR